MVARWRCSLGPGSPVCQELEPAPTLYLPSVPCPAPLPGLVHLPFPISWCL